MLLKIIRSVTFYILFLVTNIIFTISFSLLYYFAKSKYKRQITNIILNIWSSSILFLLKYIALINYEIKNYNKVKDIINNSNNKVIFACKHQSIWDCVIFNYIFQDIKYIYKKELSKIPIFGLLMKYAFGIELDRKGGIKSLKKLIKDSSDYLNQSYKLVIFPQGTRIADQSKSKDYPYLPGIASLYNIKDSIIIPVALNSGKFWNKNLTLNKGKIILEFLPPIKNGLNKKEFLHKLETDIETQSNKLLL